MKIKFYTMMFLLISAIGTFAQSIVSDSMQTGPAYANDVFYSFKNGIVKSTSNSDWHLALSVGVFNVGVRTNGATSSSGINSVTAYQLPGTDTSEWSSFDTTGYSSWTLLENSDEDWEMGALNQNGVGAEDYGWGVYDASSHAVVGHHIYLLVIKTATKPEYRKVFISSKIMGTWTIRYANIDGSNEYTESIGSTGTNAGKNFIYLNMVSHQVVDREPLKTDWDIMLTRYRAMQLGQGVYYPSTGILSNKDIVVAEARGVNDETAKLEDFIGDTSDNMSEIGADWKQLSGVTYVIVDSLCYFVKAKDGAFWKLTFTGFAGSASGNTLFTKQRVAGPTGLNQSLATTFSLGVYPNPAKESITVLFEQKQFPATIQLFDNKGQIIRELEAEANGTMVHPVSTSDLSAGLYFVKVINNGKVATQKFIISE